jgi:hypothetical protein
MSIVSPVRFRPSRTGRPPQGLRRVIAGALLLGAASVAQAVTMEVAWTDPKCDFIVTKNAAGHGIAMRLTPLTLAAGDVLSGSLDAVGYGRKIVKVGTDEAAMMQIRKYGIRRKVAFDFIYDWSRHCNPPEE